MGGGNWSKSAYASYSIDNKLNTSTVASAFINDSIATTNAYTSFNNRARQYNKDIKSYQLNTGVRECRDSEEHPNTTPIIIAFDVTGSMGTIPHKMVTKLLPKLMDRLKEIGVSDPELLFMGFGDHKCDDAPIQVTQFESDTEKICSSLQSLYLEGGGGGNGGESALLAWIVAGYHTEIDSWYKRNKKGFLFTISDEANHSDVNSRALVRFMGYENGCSAISAVEALEKAKEQYNVYHIHVNDGFHRFESSWNELLGDNVIRCNSDDINKVIADTIHSIIGNNSSDITSENKSEYKY